jgi:uncharacterized protein YdeI (YjbR/CyaY-like superfamily)
MPDVKAKLTIKTFATAAQWEAWLARQPRTSKGLWLKLAKKASGLRSVSRAEAVVGALCHGWVDGQLQKFDEHHWLIRFTPRRPNSKWSEINRNKALELIAEGRMSPAGLSQIEQAKADGRWEVAYAPQSKAAVPDDLQRALDGAPKAQRLFDELDSANRYAILYRIHDAKKAETRARRIEKYVAMLERGETIHPPKIKS